MVADGDVRTINEEEDGENTEEEKAVNDQDNIKVALWVTLTAAVVDDTKTLEPCRDGVTCVVLITLECCESFSADEV